MNTPRPTNLYTRQRFPAEIVSHCVWWYFRFCLSSWDVEELMAERGIILTYEAVRYWCRTLGQAYAHQLLRRRPRPSDTWHRATMKARGNSGQGRLVRVIAPCGPA